MSLAAMLTALVDLEQQVSDAAKTADPANELRIYPWRPSRYPNELPAIWNWIDDGTYEIDDTARATDILVVRVTIAVRPADLGESADRLVTLTDHALAVIDPALWRNQPLGGTVKRAKRLQIASRIDEFPSGQGDAPVMCMDLPIEMHLSRIVGGA